ncbi:hypothetical protein P152DRAFT_484128 [Eremomyces bilateralis CBS 781.70]|uniref:Uncharacterized protein n=1 Tax=Eremomyces bilateralis CBS 781.70 TaxID=1392243 RepID=A0A6G1FWG6_9PEZI|nr:uncharacterized protein P152DRAFT_484128 [Eremomyces bilateralis CBS 781.70]KAF1810042.1 hypothetical protein P152DRAFT_484128 [Eremomyces bilateralis CBS 781.70]
MKWSVGLTLPLLAAAAPLADGERNHVLIERQVGGGAGSPFSGFFGSGEAKLPISVTKLEPKINPKATREALVWGPYKLQPSNGTHVGGGFKMDPNSDIVTGRMGGLCADCMVLEASSETTFKDGKRMGLGDGLYTHHILFIDSGRPSVKSPLKPVCTNGTAGMTMTRPGGGVVAPIQETGGIEDTSPGISTGDSHSHGHKVRRSSSLPLDRRQMAFPGISLLVGIGHDATPHVYDVKGDDVNAGFYIGAGDPIIMMAELINYDPAEKETYIKLEYEYLSGGRPEGYLDVVQNAINMEGCKFAGLSIFPPADGPVIYESNKYDVIANGYLMNLSPHLHDGGIDFQVYVNEKEVCNSKAIYGGGAQAVGEEPWETIVGYEKCPEGIRIVKGDQVHIKAKYDLTQHRLRPSSDGDDHAHGEGAEGMALSITVFAVE